MRCSDFSHLRQSYKVFYFLNVEVNHVLSPDLFQVSIHN